jgi:hypothetical protein
MFRVIFKNGLWGIVLCLFACSVVRAAGKVVYEVKVNQGKNQILISFDNTVDDPGGTTVGYRELLIIGGKVVGGLVKPALYVMPMGGKQTIPVCYSVPSRETMRGTGQVVIEFYLHNEKNLVHTTVIPFQNGEYLVTEDRYEAVP